MSDPSPQKPKRSYPVPQIPLGKDLLVIREKLKVTHVDPNTRRTYREIALRNDAKEERQRFLLMLEDFLVGLWIEDGDGRELTYWSNEILEQEFKKPREEIIREIAPPGTEVGRVNLLVVLFAEPVKPGGTVILRLHYWDRESEGGSWYDLIPKEWFEQEKSKTAEYFDTFIEIEGPPDSRIIIDPRHGKEGMPIPPEVSTPDGVKQNDRSNFKQVRFPAGHPRVGFDYRVAPLRSEVIMTWVGFHLLWVVPTGMLMLTGMGFMELKGAEVTEVPRQGMLIHMTEHKAGEVVATLGIAGVISIVAFLRPVWINRALYLWPLMCNLALLATSLATP